MNRSSHLAHRLPFAVALAAFCLTLWFAWQERASSDLEIFRASAELWQKTGAPYADPTKPNLNPPLPVLTLFAWLPWVGIDAAFVLWTAAGIAALAVAYGWLRPFDARQRYALLACLAAVPAHEAWRHGQLTWILLPVATAAYLAHRAGRIGQAGCWLGLLIALRPPIALVALALPFRLCLVAGIASAALTAGSIAVAGWPTFAAWLELGTRVSWLSDSSNASVWGLAARIIGVEQMAAFPRWLQLGVPALGLLALVPIARSRGERRWVLAWLWGTLLSPLGWIYYLPLSLAPMVKMAAFPIGLRIALVLSFVPWTVLRSAFGPALDLVWFSWSGLVVLCAFVGTLLARPPALETSQPPARDLT